MDPVPDLPLPGDLAGNTSIDFDVLLGGPTQMAQTGGEMFFPFFGGGTLPAQSTPGLPLLDLADSSGSLGRGAEALHSGDSHEQEGKSRPAKKSKLSQEKSKASQKKYRDKKRAEVEDLRRHNTDLAASLQEVSAEKSKLEQRCSLLEKALHMRSAQPPEQEAGQESIPEHVLALRAFVKQIRSGGGPADVADGSDFTRLTPADMHRTWRAYVRRLTQLMLEGGSEEGTAASAELHMLIQAQRRATMAMGRHDSRRMLAGAAFIRQSARKQAGEPGEEHLRKVLEAAQLTTEQKVVLVETRTALLTQVRIVLDERRAILKALQEALPGPSTGLQTFRPFSFAALISAADRLQENHRADCRAALTFITRVKAVLRPEQEAQLVVTSYPHLPDFLALQNLICREFGLQPVEAVDQPTAGMDFLRHPGENVLEEIPALEPEEGRRQLVTSPGEALAALAAAGPPLKPDPGEHLINIRDVA